MAATQVISIDYIVKTPGVCGGAARIDNTRLTVHAIVGQIKAGATVAELVEGYIHLSLTEAQVHAALAYYYDHQAEIDELLKEDARLLDEIKAEAVEIRSLTADGTPYLTARQAARMLGISTQSSQIAHLCQQGKLDCRKIANRWLVSRASIEAYSASDRRPGPR